MEKPELPKRRDFTEHQGRPEDQLTMRRAVQELVERTRNRLLRVDNEGRFIFPSIKHEPVNGFAFDPDRRASQNELLERAMQMARELGAHMPPIREKQLNMQVQRTDELFRLMCPNFYDRRERFYSVFPVPVYFPRINIDSEILDNDTAVIEAYLDCCNTAIECLSRQYGERFRGGKVYLDFAYADLEVNPEIARKAFRRSGFALHLPLCYLGIEEEDVKGHIRRSEDEMLSAADPLAVLISSIQNVDMLDGYFSHGQLLFGTKKPIQLKSYGHKEASCLRIEKTSPDSVLGISSTGLIFNPKEILPVSGNSL